MATRLSFIQKLKRIFCDVDHYSDEMIVIPENGWFRKLWLFMGPGLLVGIAYIDPGNIDADINAGATEKYNLIWAMFLCTFMGFILQILSAKLGIYTGMDLAYACKTLYSAPVRYTLWVFAELSVILSDIPEIIGTATALKLLFNIELWIGVIITIFGTFIFLGIQYFGVRYLELFIGIFIGIISFCFFLEMILSKPSFVEVMSGFVPRIENTKAFFIITTLMGSIVMPHNLFLHSSLVRSRQIRSSVSAKKEAVFFNILESGFSIFISFLINVSVIILSGTKFYGKYQDTGLMSATILLDSVFEGKWASIMFGIGLLASGQSSTITGTYAGQFIMEGFLDLKIKMFLRNLITRSVAILPSLLFTFSSVYTVDYLILLSSCLLSLQLPFVLVPLIKVTSSPAWMTQFFVNSKLFTLSCWLLSFLTTACNLTFIAVQIYGIFQHISDYSVTSQFLITLAMAILSVAYLLFLGYLIYLPVNGQNAVLSGEEVSLNADHRPIHKNLDETTSHVDASATPPTSPVIHLEEYVHDCP